jgi:hypothetical protein
MVRIIAVKFRSPKFRTRFAFEFSRKLVSMKPDRRLGVYVSSYRGSKSSRADKIPHSQAYGESVLMVSFVEVLKFQSEYFHHLQAVLLVVVGM